MKILDIFDLKIPQASLLTSFITGADLLDNLHNLEILKTRQYKQFLVFCDDKVNDLYGERLKVSLSKVSSNVHFSVIAIGEQQKNILLLPKILKPFLKGKITRNSAIVAFGGGVVSDIGGFISSILFRGVDLINIPTTLLAQIDASIGGKNGVDFTLSENHFVKNMLGTIKQPNIVITDVSLLKSLPEKEIINGLGEMIKYHLGWSQPSLKDLHKIMLLKRADMDDLHRIIKGCQKIKMNIIKKDLLDILKIRESLNLGHTIGHALEGVSRGKLNHGGAVALGLLVETRISHLLKLATKETFHKVAELVNSLNIKFKINRSEIKQILTVLNFDKKGGRFALIRKIGDVRTDIYVDKNLIIQALTEILL